MTCQISDVATTLAADGTYRPIKKAAVQAVPSQLPIFTKQAGVFTIVQNPAPLTFTDQNGNWTLTLPWPSETSPAGVTWQIAEPDGTVWQGTVPEGITGPLTLRTLQQTYSWAVVSAPGASALGIQRLLNGLYSLTLDQYGHLITAAGKPTISVLAGAGTGASASLDAAANDVSGIVTATVGSAATSGADQFQVTYANPYTNVPVVILLRVFAGGGDQFCCQHSYVDRFMIGGLGISGSGDAGLTLQYLVIGR